jgi:hypothetical protein
MRLTLQSLLEGSCEPRRFGFRCEEQVLIRSQPQCRAHACLRCAAGSWCRADAKHIPRDAERVPISTQYEARRGRQ